MAGLSRFVLFSTTVLLVLVSKAAARPVADGKDAPHDSDGFIVKFSSPDVELQGVQVEKKTGKALGLAFGRVKIKKNQEKLEDVMDKVSKMAGVEYVEKNYFQYANIIPNDSGFSSQWGMRKINAPAAWDIYTGDNTDNDGLVCIIDTGIDITHPDIIPNLHPTLSQGWNAITNTPGCQDGHGHGTHCAGVVAASTNNGNGVAGINWRGRMIGCKFMSDAGSGNTLDAVDCVSWCVQNGASISSNSWGGGGYSQALYDAINAANTQGHLFIVAAGNDAKNIDVSPSYPASYNLPNIIGVAATDSNDALAYFSNFGSAGATSYVEIAAPGLSIYSTYHVAGGSYTSLSGTSMACPHVAGVAGLVLSAANGAMTVAQLKSVLLSSSDTNIASLNGKVVNGARLNALKALQAALNLSPAPPPPPPLPLTLAAVALNVGAIPFSSPNLDISTGTFDAIDSQIASQCISATFNSRMTSTAYKKHIWKLTGLPTAGTMSVDDCLMPLGSWDSVSIVMACNQGTYTCACYTNDDGCGGAGGDRVTGVPLAAGQDYYSIIIPYSGSTISGVYQLRVGAIDVVYPSPPPPVDVVYPSPPPTVLVVPSPPVVVAPSPPPPASAGPFPYTALPIGAARPWISPIQNLALGDSVSIGAIAACGTTTGIYRPRLTNTVYKKQVWELTGLTATFTVDTCSQPNGRWDSLMSFLTCNAALTSCTCSSNNDACAVGGGERLRNLSYRSTNRYFVIVYAVGSTVTGTYQVTVR